MLDENKCFEVDVIMCAAPFAPGLSYTDSRKMQDIFESRIQNILEAAMDNQIDVMILGAFGCGAFGNPPELVAKAFWTVIKKPRYRFAFKMMVFAIKNSAGKGNICPNITAFSSVMKSKE